MRPESNPRFSPKVHIEGDRPRLTCDDCGHVHYDNPRVVAGVVVRHGEQFLLCRRAINPSHGKWTMPAGFLETEEASSIGALRETWEEARARVKLDGLLGVYDITHISQVMVIYRGTLIGEDFAAGPESLEVRLFTRDEIPWDELAFPSVRWALEAELAIQDGREQTPFVHPAPESASLDE